MSVTRAAGTAEVQGRLWGARARDWAEAHEAVQRPYYEEVLTVAGVGPGTRLLDAGCGSGLAAQIAAERGAQVAGLDASAPLLAIARERVHGSEFHEGELEELPFADDAFDVVTGFNSFQYAADPAAALREAGRVARPGGLIAVVTWGAPEDCEAAGYLRALGSLLPPPPPGAPGPFALSEPGALEALVAEAGLTPGASGEVAAPFAYPNLVTALRGLLAAGPAIRAIEHSGEPAVVHAVTDSFVPFVTSAGSVRMENTFRYLIATA